MYILVAQPRHVGKRRRAVSVATRSNSVKRETTPVSKSAVTIAHSQQQPQQHSSSSSGGGGGKSAKPGGATKVKKQQGVRQSGGTSNEDLGCNEEIGMEEEDDDEEEEEEGECSATQCLQPVADQIIWVQCDHCQEWFHCVCVGLTKEYAEQIDTYKCASCKQAATDAQTISTASTTVPLRPVYSVKVEPKVPVSSTMSSVLPGQT